MASVYGPTPSLGVPFVNVQPDSSCGSARALEKLPCQRWCDANKYECAQVLVNDLVQTACPGKEKTRCECLRRIQHQLETGTIAPFPGSDPEGMRKMAIQVIQDECAGSQATGDHYNPKLMMASNVSWNGRIVCMFVLVVLLIIFARR
jgi:hypothetical protein